MVKLVSKKKAIQIMNILCSTYPEAECELNYKDTFQLLISVILSAQSTDKQVNKATMQLFKHYPQSDLLAKADLNHVKNLIKSTGYFNVKAQNIIACAIALVEKYNGYVPDTLEELITLPGVGRKTANVVLGVAFNKRAWTVDTHLNRLSQRLGFSTNTDPYKIELDLQKLFPEQDWTKYSIVLIFHGRRCCAARLPNCVSCPVNYLCPSVNL